MGGSAKPRTAKGNSDEGKATVASLSQADQHGAEAPLIALVSLAEELGRLLARRELAKIEDRRAYAMPELLLGAFVMAFVWVLIARVLGWLVR